MGEQLELPSSGEEETAESKAEPSVEEFSISMAERLAQRGLTEATARKLVKNYSTERIQRQMEIFDWLVEHGSPLVRKNPAGYLRKSIEENYEPPADYLRWQEREVAEQKKAQEIEAEQERMRGIQRQVDEYRERLKEQDRQLLRQEAIELIESNEAIKNTTFSVMLKEGDILLIV